MRAGESRQGTWRPPDRTPSDRAVPDPSSMKALSPSAAGGAARAGPAPASRGTRRWAFPLTLGALAASLFVVLAIFMRTLEQRGALGPGLSVYESAGTSARLAAQARVGDAVRAMKLVTVQIKTAVTVESTTESWRGDVKASVVAPVTLSYGTDLSGLSRDSVSFSPLLNSCVVRVPGPQRISTEVYSDQEQSQVQVGWLRFRSRAGEYYLGLARRDLSERAREMVLAPSDAASVRAATRGQLTSLIHSIVGKGVSVRVLFDDERGEPAPPPPESAGVAP